MCDPRNWSKREIGTDNRQSLNFWENDAVEPKIAVWRAIVWNLCWLGVVLFVALLVFVLVSVYRFSGCDWVIKGVQNVNIK